MQAQYRGAVQPRDTSHNMKLLLLVAVLSAAVCLGRANPAPPGTCKEGPPHGLGIIYCTYGTPTFSSCWDNQTVKQTIPTLVHGVPSLQIQTIEPVVIKDIIPLGQGCVLKDCKVTGGSKAIIKGFNTDLTSKLLYSYMVPEMKMKCLYVMKKGFLGAPQENSGTFTLLWPNYTSKIQYAGNVYPKCGQVRVNLANCTSTFLSQPKFVAEFSGLKPPQNKAMASKLFPVFKEAFPKPECNWNRPFLARCYDCLGDIRGVFAATTKDVCFGTPKEC